MSADADETLIPHILDAAEGVSVDQRMDGDTAMRVRLNLEEVLLGIISYGCAGRPGQRVDVSISRDGDEMVYSVRDTGMPYDYSTLEGSGYADIARILTGMDNGPELRNLGRGGKEQTFRFRVPPRCGEELPCTEEASLQPPEFDIHDMRPEECMQVTQCLYDEFGYTYINDMVYYPEKLEAAKREGRFMPFTATAPDGEVAGFLSLMMNPRLPGTAELGMAVVKKKFRRCSLISRMTDVALARARETGLRSVNAEPVAYHPYTQKVCDAMGMAPCAVAFNRTPDDMSVSFCTERCRRSLFWAVMTISDSDRTIFVPEEASHLVDLVVGGCGISRSRGASGDPSGITDISSDIDMVLRLGRTYADSIGQDSFRTLRSELHRIKAAGCELAELMINLQDPAAPWLYGKAKEIGYFCTGMLPASSKCDYLMMQNILHGVTDYGSMETTESFGNLLSVVRELDPEGDL